MALVDPANPYTRDAYKILVLTDELLEYEHLGSGLKFRARKVSADFSSPE